MTDPRLSDRARAAGSRAAGELSVQATRALSAVAVVGLMLAVMWVLELVDYAGDGVLDQYGIRSRDFSDLPDIFSAPFLHANLDHLAANTVPFAILGLVAAIRGVGKFLLMNLIVIVVGGVGVWFTGPSNAETLGASILVFGYFGYIVGRGVFERRIADAVIAVVVALFYWTILYGLVPNNDQISWQGHLFGLIGGLISSFVLRRRSRAS
ncbi:MAG: rhomboid family intramembrane serine protease [Streptosporangiaceae bacterium]